MTETTDPRILAARQALTQIMWTLQRETYYARQSGRRGGGKVTPAQRRRMNRKGRRNRRLVEISWSETAAC